MLHWGHRRHQVLKRDKMWNIKKKKKRFLSLSVHCGSGNVMYISGVLFKQKPLYTPGLKTGSFLWTLFITPNFFSWCSSLTGHSKLTTKKCTDSNSEVDIPYKKRSPVKQTTYKLLLNIYSQQGEPNDFWQIIAWSVSNMTKWKWVTCWQEKCMCNRLFAWPCHAAPA